MAETIYYDEKISGDAVLTVFRARGLCGTYPVPPHATIGRSSSGGTCDIPIDSPIVSRKHGEIVFSDGRYRYRDLESTNGTYLNGCFLKGSASDGARVAELSNGDVLEIRVKGGQEESADRVVAIFSRTLSVADGWAELPLVREMAEVLIGRGGESALRLEDETISERHASFFQSANGWAIIDHASKNGVFVNGKRLTTPRYLKMLDVIRIADAYFVFFGDRLLYSGMEAKPSREADGAAKEELSGSRKQGKGERPAQGELVIHIVERSVIQRFKRMILLQDIDLSVSGGDMVLILGGSGAGKTTFLNAVMGYEKAKGQILYRDTDIYEEYEQMKYEIGFVPQQDLLRGSDAVYDTLANAAEMKLPRSVTHEKRQSRIQEVLDEMGLVREKDSLVSKLSGGQRKRLSIAVELIADPSLFFLDEPDSGIDDIMGRGLMENLRRIADRGKIVMLITHSPERAANLFDKIIVLAKSVKDNCGHLAFFGTVEEAFQFFGVGSFREIVQKINRPDENGEGLSDFYIEQYRTYTEGR